VIWLLVLLLLILAIGGGVALSKFLFLLLIVRSSSRSSARSVGRPSAPEDTAYERGPAYAGPLSCVVSTRL